MKPESHNKGHFLMSYCLASLRKVALLICFSLLVACGGGGGGDDTSDMGSGDGGSDTPMTGGPTPPTTSSPGSVFSFGATTDATGLATANFTLEPFTNKFSISVLANGQPLRFISVESDRGVNYAAPNGAFVSLAQEFSFDAKTMNAPSRDFDQGVLDFAEYRVVAQAGSANLPVVFSVTSRADANLRNGTMRVNVFLVGAAAQRSGASRSISGGLAKMTEIFQLGAGITLNVAQIPIDGPDILPDPTAGSDFYLSAASSAGSPAVNLFVGGEVGIAGGDSTLGISADIPGPVEPTTRSAVAVSLFTSAGPDGTFSDDEIRLLGETFAHEISHFMGLFHPIEIVGAQVVAEDPLIDTPTCSTLSNCLNNDNLIRNLMFPFPIPDGGRNNETIPQDRLTSQQRGVSNLYSAVD
jgi:hypothetical protein